MAVYAPGTPGTRRGPGSGSAAGETHDRAGQEETGDETHDFFFVFSSGGATTGRGARGFFLLEVLKSVNKTDFFFCFFLSAKCHNFCATRDRRSVGRPKQSGGDKWNELLKYHCGMIHLEGHGHGGEQSLFVTVLVRCCCQSAVVTRRPYLSRAHLSLRLCLAASAPFSFRRSFIRPSLSACQCACLCASMYLYLGLSFSCLCICVYLKMCFDAIFFVWTIMSCFLTVFFSPVFAVSHPQQVFQPADGFPAKWERQTAPPSVYGAYCCSGLTVIAQTVGEGDRLVVMSSDLITRAKRKRDLQQVIEGTSSLLSFFSLKGGGGRLCGG